MKGWLATTDYDWYDFLRHQSDIEEVNFWQPSGRSFKVLQAGEPLLFKLKSPHNAIGGFGLFARHDVLPDWLAWEAFGVANGAADHAAMRARIERYIPRERHHPRAPYSIGCIMVCEPVFFPRDAWIEQPRDWSKNIVSGKSYDLADGEGERMWDQCLERARDLQPARVGEGAAPRFGEGRLVHPRLGQGTFRIAVTQAYGQACAVTREHSLPVLEAAHIRPYAEGGLHRVSNGLLLRTDIHRLYDRGYVTVTPDLHFEVGNRLKHEWHNGKSYYALHGRRIAVPSESADRPDVSLLEWHASTVYRG